MVYAGSRRSSAAHSPAASPRSSASRGSRSPSPQRPAGSGDEMADGRQGSDEEGTETVCHGMNAVF